MKRAIRLAAVYVLYATGVLQLCARLMLRRKAVVLMYHRVLTPTEQATTWSHPAIVVSAATFERQMQLLKRFFRVLSVAEFQACLDAGRFEPGGCMVTFDDGWIDTYTEAWPILRRYGIPALVFLPSAYIGTGEVFWQERLGRVLHRVWQRGSVEAAFAEQVRPVLAAFNLEPVLRFSPSTLRDEILALVRSRKTNGSLDPQAPIRALLEVVADDDDPAADVDRFIDWDQAREMARGGVAFGAHGHTHRLLTTLPLQEVRREVEASRDAVLDAVGGSPSAFCYPNGAWNESVAACVKSARFAMAFSTDRGRVDAASSRFALQRVNVHEDMTSTMPMFLARLVGIV